MAPSTRVEIPSTKEELEQEIIRVERTLGQLRVAWNSYAPISQLPAEIFCKIFAIILLGDTTRRRYYFTHVCHDWRQIALAAPSLWSEIRCDLPAWVDELISRAQTSDISIRHSFKYLLDKPAENLTKAIRRVLEVHGGRVECVYLWQINSWTASQLFDIPEAFKTRASNLKTLFLLGKYKEKLPENLLERFPRLHRLELARFAMDWRASLSERLMDLRIEKSPPPSMLELINLLSNLPNLIYLGLTDCLPRGTESPSSEVGGKKAYLSRLKRLNLGLSHPLELAFVQYIIFPPTVRVNVIAHDEARSSYPLLLNNFILDGKGRDPFRSLEIIFTREQITIRAWSGSFGQVKNYDHGLATVLGPAPISLTISLGKHSKQARPAAIRMIIGVFLDGVSLEELETLKFANRYSSYIRFSIFEAFGNLPRLKRVIISGGYSIWPLVGEEWDRECKDAEAYNILPLLEDLAFVDVAFETRPLQNLTDGIRDIQHWLEMRRELQMPRLERLKFSQCSGLFASDMTTLYDLAKEIGYMANIVYHY